MDQVLDVDVMWSATRVSPLSGLLIPMSKDAAPLTESWASQASCMGTLKLYVGPLPHRSPAASMLVPSWNIAGWTDSSGEVASNAVGFWSPGTMSAIAGIAARAVAHRTPAMKADGRETSRILR